MTDDDLVKRLRANSSWGDDRFAEAADRIEALTTEHDALIAQIDAAREAALREVLVALQVAGLFGKTTVEHHAALEQYCLCRDAILAMIREGDQP